MMLLYEVIQKYLWFEVRDSEAGIHTGPYESTENFGTELRILILVLQVLFNRCFTVGSPLHY